MKAVILAGGRGTRLAPYTTVLPKPLLPLGDVPILEIILRQLKHHGFSEVTLACGYLAELIQAYLMNSRISKEIKIHYCKEYEPLGTAGALAGIDGLNETFLVMNGDILTTIDYSKLVQFHRSKKAALTIAITQKKVQIDLGVLVTDENHNIIGYDEKPTKNYSVSTGIYVYEPRVLDLIKPQTYLDFPHLVSELIKEKEPVMGYATDAFWLDMGNKGDYERAVREFEDNRSEFRIDN